MRFLLRLGLIVAAGFVLMASSEGRALALTITIDASTEGGIVVTSDSSTTVVTTGIGTIIDLPGGRQATSGIPVEWAVILDPGLIPGQTSPLLLVLEPGTNVVSNILDPRFDALSNVLVVFSEVEGSPIPLPPGCPSFPGFACIVETPGFQDLASTLYPGLANVSILFRSVVDRQVVPEPGIVALMGAAFVGFAVIAARLRLHRG